jgi:3-oxoacyl-[acyl-carrier-protein] synthase II
MKIAVTGVGIVSPIGSNLSENMQNLFDMTVGSSDNRIPPDNLSSELIKSTKIFYSQYTDEQASKHINLKELRYSDPVIKTSMMAVDEAVQMSGIDLPKETPVVVGSIQGGVTTYNAWVDKLSRKASRKVHPKVLLSSSHEYIGNLISERYQIHGPSCVVSATCISGVQALEFGRNYLMQGHDCAIIGASDHMTASLTMYYFEQLGALSPTSEVKPWDVSRNGTVMGEGSVYLVIEPLDSALKRKAKIRWVVDGIATSSDAGHPTAPSPEGIGGKIAIKEAMRQSNVSPKDYSVLNAHGTGTVLGDPIEYNVLRHFYDSGKIYSNKGQIGHLMGASCLAELVLGAEAMRDDMVPGNAGLQEPFPNDGHFEFMFSPQKYSYDHMMKTSFGFGGRCSAVSVRKV